MRAPTPQKERVAEKIACSVCGFRYNPAEHPSCAACPLHAGCTVSCCPNCGVSNIDPNQSRLAGWFRRIFKGGSHAAS